MDDSVPEYESVGGCASVLKACPVGRAHSAWGAHFVGGWTGLGDAERLGPAVGRVLFLCGLASAVVGAWPGGYIV